MRNEIAHAILAIIERAIAEDRASHLRPVLTILQSWLATRDLSGASSYTPRRARSTRTATSPPITSTRSPGLANQAISHSGAETPIPHAGVVMNVVVAKQRKGGPRSARRALDETIGAARLLRARMSPMYPMALVHNSEAASLLEAANAQHLWDVHVPLIRGERTAPELAALIDDLRTSNETSYNARAREGMLIFYLGKFSAYLLSPFERSLFLDSDVFVMKPTFVHNMLAKSLSVADVAAPLDPNRLKQPFANHSAPLLCSCIVAFNSSSADVRSFFVGAAKRLLWRQHTRLDDGPDKGENTKPEVRQSDQEMMWFEWTRGVHPRLRVLVLPEEAYCPMSTRIDPSGKFAKWNTNFWGYGYACQSVHGHNCWGSIKNTEAYKSLPPLR